MIARDIYFTHIRFYHTMTLIKSKHYSRSISKSKTSIDSQNFSTSYFSAHSIKCAEIASSIIADSRDGILTINQDKQPLMGAHVEYMCEQMDSMFVKVTNKSILLDPSPSGFECSMLLRSWPIGDVTLHGKLLHTKKRSQIVSSFKNRCDQKLTRFRRKDHVRVFRIIIDNCLLSFNYDLNDKNNLLSINDLIKAQTTDMTKYIRRFIAQVNDKLWSEVNSIASDALGIENVSNAELLWIDRVGIYVGLTHPKNKLLRIPFLRYCRDERDLCSQFTMLSQVSWNRQNMIKNS
jgi:hypothetical protein